MPDYSILAAEINNDPLSRGYSGLNDQQVADSLNTSDRTVSRISYVGAVRSYLSTQINGTGINQRSVLALLAEFADSGTVRGAVPSVTPSTSLDARRSAAQMIVFMLRYGSDTEGFLVNDANVESQFVSIGPDGNAGPSILSNSQLLDIAALAEESVSRGVEIGWGIATNDDIARVRA